MKNIIKAALAVGMVSMFGAGCAQNDVSKDSSREQVKSVSQKYEYVRGRAYIYVHEVGAPSDLDAKLNPELLERLQGINETANKLKDTIKESVAGGKIGLDPVLNQYYVDEGSIDFSKGNYLEAAEIAEYRDVAGGGGAKRIGLAAQTQRQLDTNVNFRRGALGERVKSFSLKSLGASGPSMYSNKVAYGTEGSNGDSSCNPFMSADDCSPDYSGQCPDEAQGMPANITYLYDVMSTSCSE